MTATVLTLCDRCPATALVVVRKGPAELALCGHDYHDLGALLGVRGWEVVSDGRARLAEQEARR